MRFKLIACEIFFRECSYLAATSPHQVDLEFLPRGLHDLKGDEICGYILEKIRMAESVSAAENDPAKYDAILLGYALCNHAVIGLRAERTTMVVPRANDCIALFFGDQNRFMEYFNSHPGTYYKTGGWIERGADLNQFAVGSFQQMCGLDGSFQDWVKKYGEDNAKYLWEQLAAMQRNYSQLTYLRMGLGPEQIFEDIVRREARDKGWGFERVEGSLDFLRDLIYGNWDDERFLIVPPGKTIRNSFDEKIIRVSDS